MKKVDRVINGIYELYQLDWLDIAVNPKDYIAKRHEYENNCINEEFANKYKTFEDYELATGYDVNGEKKCYLTKDEFFNKFIKNGDGNYISMLLQDDAELYDAFLTLSETKKWNVKFKEDEYDYDADIISSIRTEDDIDLE